MTPAEADRILFAMNAMWPGMDDAQVEIWARKLLPLRFELAEKAMDQLIETEERRPPFARFRAAYEANQPVEPTRIAIDEESWVGPEKSKRQIALIRDMLEGLRPKMQPWARRG